MKPTQSSLVSQSIAPLLNIPWCTSTSDRVSHTLHNCGRGSASRGSALFPAMFYHPPANFGINLRAQEMLDGALYTPAAAP